MIHAIKKIRSNRGISLMELLITTVIIGIVAAMAVPRMQTAFDRMTFKSSVRELSSSLRLARSTAISQKNQFGVHFDASAKTITLFKDLVNPNGYDFVSGDSALRVDTLPSEFATLTTDVVNNVILFRPNGSASFDGTGNIISLAVTENIVGICVTNILSATGRVASNLSIY